ncbi:MAG: phosphotransferase [Clostridia bacterium]|nr:phosphotransferase [Clostridia bacterium]
MGANKKVVNVAEAINAFDYWGTLVDFRPYGNGHINDTFLVRFRHEGKIRKYILQRINKDVFKKPEEVMANMIGVTSSLRKKIKERGGDPERETINVIKTKDGKGHHIDGYGEYWRSLVYVGDTVSLDLPEDNNDFYQSAVAFGSFQHDLGDYPAETLFETIKDFHNTPVRYQNFLKSVEKNASGRANNALAEIEFVKQRKDFVSVLEDAHARGELPKRVTHNDTKINNVLLDIDTREPVCVVDLDTIMPGYSVNDFGDSIRFGASTAAEDEKDLSKVHFDINLFETYTRGFLKGCGGTLKESEIMLLPEGAKMMTLECGMRFLADYIDGDTYFKTAYPDHNLVRCRTQFKLVEEMEDKWEEMKRIVEKYSK